MSAGMSAKRVRGRPATTAATTAAAVTAVPRGSSGGAFRRKHVVGRRARPPRSILLQRLNLAHMLAAAAISASLVAIYRFGRIPSNGRDASAVTVPGQIARPGTDDLSSTSAGAASSPRDTMADNLRGTADDLPPFRKTQPSPAALPRCSAPLRPSDVSFTLVTQSSPDRLWMVRKHCARWPGPVSVAVHTDDSAEEVLRYLTKGGGEEGDGGCRADRLVVATIPTSPVGGNGGGDDDDGEYPVNALRNAALANVRTTHVFYVDVDFWTSANLYDSLNLGFVRAELANDTRLALVIPSFEFRPHGKCRMDPEESKKCEGGDDCEEREEMCRRHNSGRMPLTRDDLVSLIRGREAGVFDPSNVGGFLSTRYTDWFGMDEGDLLDVPCITSNRYEPFFAVRYCRELPPYQEAFTGYGKNKITNIMHMRRMGYVFSQVGSVFAIHFPHGYSRVREVWNEGWDLRKKLAANHPKEVVDKQHDWTRYKRGRVDRVFVRFKRWLADKVPDEARLQMCEDAQNDDVKLWV